MVDPGLGLRFLDLESPVLSQNLYGWRKKGYKEKHNKMWRGEEVGAKRWLASGWRHQERREKENEIKESQFTEPCPSSQIHCRECTWSLQPLSVEEVRGRNKTFYLTLCFWTAAFPASSPGWTLSMLRWGSFCFYHLTSRNYYPACARPGEVCGKNL